MSDFLRNTAANIVGTFIGAGLALLSTWWLQRRSAGETDRRRLQGVIDRFYRSRALTPVASDDSGPLTEQQRRDLERCTASVIESRDRVAAVSDHLAVYTGCLEHLDQIFAHCLQYLNAVETNETRYVSHLMKLREAVIPELKGVVAAVPGLTWREPGTADPGGVNRENGAMFLK